MHTGYAKLYYRNGTFRSVGNKASTLYQAWASVLPYRKELIHNGS